MRNYPRMNFPGGQRAKRNQVVGELSEMGFSKINGGYYCRLQYYFQPPEKGGLTLLLGLIVWV